MQTNPTGLPELFKPTRDLNFDQKCEKMIFEILKLLKMIVFHYNSMNFYDPWVETDTTGPGEAVFAQ